MSKKGVFYMSENQHSRSRKWQITINNPNEKKLTHSEIKNILKTLPSLLYWCMADEVGNETKTYHTHLFIYLKNPIRFDTLQNKFKNIAHIENVRGTGAENRDYVFKTGKWKLTDKSDTQIKNTQEEWGKLPNSIGSIVEDNQKFYGTLYQLIEDGYTDGEIIKKNPNYIPLISKFPTIRNAIRTQEFAYTRRNVEVYYVSGDYRWNKIKEIRDTYGDENVYSIADYNQPFEDYDCQDVLILEEFDNNIPLPLLLHYLQDYPVKLPARYANKVSCFTKVYIVSPFPFIRLYSMYYYDEDTCYRLFVDKIKTIYECDAENSFNEFKVLQTWKNEPELVPTEDTTAPKA